VLFGVEEVRFWQRFGPQNSGAGWHGLISTVAPVLGFLLWPIVFLALVRGWRLAARSLSAVLAVVGAISVTSLYTFAYLVPEFVTVLAIGLATQKDFPAMRRARRLAPMLLALTAVGWYLEARSTPRGDSWVDWLWAYSPLAAFCLAVLVLAIRLARRSAVWPLAFAVVGTFLAGQWALISLKYEASLLDPRLETAVLFEGCLVLIAGYAVLRRMLKAQTAQSVGGAI
jgi:cytochrome bd-type quinol oxidase subunit 2